EPPPPVPPRGLLPLLTRAPRPHPERNRSAFGCRLVLHPVADSRDRAGEVTRRELALRVPDGDPSPDHVHPHVLDALELAERSLHARRAARAIHSADPEGAHGAARRLSLKREAWHHRCVTRSAAVRHARYPQSPNPARSHGTGRGSVRKDGPGWS